MTWMFRSADSFNSDLSSWDGSSVTNMSWMFDGLMPCQMKTNAPSISHFQPTQTGLMIGGMVFV
jgi:surface protein